MITGKQHPYIVYPVKTRIQETIEFASKELRPEWRSSLLIPRMICTPFNFEQMFTPMKRPL